MVSAAMFYSSGCGYFADDQKPIELQSLCDAESSGERIELSMGLLGNGTSRSSRPHLFQCLSSRYSEFDRDIDDYCWAHNLPDSESKPLIVESQSEILRVSIRQAESACVNETIEVPPTQRTVGSGDALIQESLCLDLENFSRATIAMVVSENGISAELTDDERDCLANSEELLSLKLESICAAGSLDGINLFSTREIVDWFGRCGVEAGRLNKVSVAPRN